MKVLSWNVNGAGRSNSRLWDAFCREDPDIALLQELGGLPSCVENRYCCHLVRPRYFHGGFARFHTAILSKWPLETSSFLSSRLDWVNAIQGKQRGWLVEGQIAGDTGDQFHVVSVHSPAWPIPRESLKGVDATEIKLENNPDVWFTEILWSLLSEAHAGDRSNWIVAGDFNSSILFDKPRDRGNCEIVKRMNHLGLVDGLGHHQQARVPTFRHSSGSVNHQLDYCYLSKPMLKRLVRATVLTEREVFGPEPRLSDHLPVLCEFD